MTPEGVELTFLAERRAGFLAWVAKDAAGVLHRVMRQYERAADVDEMVAEWLAEDEAASGPDEAGGEDERVEPKRPASHGPDQR